MNKMIMMARLTRDADIRYTQDGKPVVRFDVAVNRRFKREGDPDADFFYCVAFGKNAEAFEKCDIGKGTKLLIEGEVRNNNYTDNDGVKHYGDQIIVNTFEFCESKGSVSAAPVPQPDADGFMNLDDFSDEELPFS